MSSFQTSKSVFQFLTIVSWGIVLLGVLAVLREMVDGRNWYSVVAVTPIAMTGILTVVAAQMGLAQIATAENTAALVELMRRDNAQSGMAGHVKGQPSAAPIATAVRHSQASLGRKVGEKIKTYQGFEIIKAHDGVTVEGRPFENVLQAERWISTKA